MSDSSVPCPIRKLDSPTFSIYTLSPHFLRRYIVSRLTWSVKQLIDAWPSSQMDSSLLNDFDLWFRRLLACKADGCDFGLHHQLVSLLLTDDFEQARDLVKYAAHRKPLLRSACLVLGSIEPLYEACIYENIFRINDLHAAGFSLAAPNLNKAEQLKSWIAGVTTLLKETCPNAYAELDAFQPIWLLSAVQEGGTFDFGGYSSSLAFGTIALSVNLSCLSSVLIQMIHEMAHQVLFAVAAETPLVFNDPSESFSSPLRPDKRPMDGILHAAFVSARVYEVICDINSSEVWERLPEVDQIVAAKQCEQCLRDIEESLQVISDNAQLSPLGERVVEKIKRISLTHE